MRKQPWILLLLISLLPLFSQAEAYNTVRTGVISGCEEGNGQQGEISRPVAGFDQLQIQGAFEVTLSQKQKFHCQIKGDDNLLKHISTQVQGSTLIIQSQGSLCPQLPLQLELSAPQWQQITLQGANNLTGTGLLSESLQINLQGSSTANMTGKVQKLQLTLEGASQCSATALEAEEVQVDAQGACQARIHAKEKLRISAHGVCEVYYKGKPHVEKSITGIATVAPQ